MKMMITMKTIMITIYRIIVARQRCPGFLLLSLSRLRPSGGRVSGASPCFGKSPPLKHEGFPLLWEIPPLKHETPSPCFGRSWPEAWPRHVTSCHATPRHASSGRCQCHVMPRHVASRACTLNPKPLTLNPNVYRLSYISRSSSRFWVWLHVGLLTQLDTSIIRPKSKSKLSRFWARLSAKLASYTHIYISLSMYIYIYIYTSLSLYIYLYTFYIYIYISLYVCVYIYIYIHISLSLCIYIYIYTHIHVSLSMCIYIYICIHMYIYTHISLSLYK